MEVPLRSSRYPKGLHFDERATPPREPEDTGAGES